MHKQIWYIHNGLLNIPIYATWMTLKSIMPNERNQTQKNYNQSDSIYDLLERAKLKGQKVCALAKLLGVEQGD